MKLKILASLMLAVSLLTGLVLPSHASATNYGNVNIIDDSVMNNTGAMSDSQVQSFLNGFAGNCLGGSFSTADPQGYSNGSYQFGGNVNGGKAISDISKHYNLNPQVLLVTLEKEQGLISRNGNCSYGYQGDAPVGASCNNPNGSGPSYCSYACRNTPVGGCVAVATGYGCPGYCRKDFSDFSKQISGTAWLLRFAEARAYGQLTGYSGYDVGDESLCYTGAMTTGYRQRSNTAYTCSGVPGNQSIYYDGSYTDADGNTMHISNGSTASMLNYTPFYARSYTDDSLFHTSFTKWFGSTSYIEPLGSLLAVDNQTGQIYFISLTNNTRYAIRSWSTLVAYNLNGYPIIPMDDSAIIGYANGGDLKTLVWDSNTQSLFLVDHGQKYSFSQYCSQWGLDCLGSTPGSVSNINNAYFDQVMITGGSNQPLMQVNGQFFLMTNGTRAPFASTADMQAAGYSPDQAVPIIQTDLNAPQPLGPLQIHVPQFITFNSSLMMYFDGQSYHQVPNLPIYYAWGSQPVTIPPSSATDTNVPSNASTLSNWVKDSTNNYYYLVDNGNKMNITADSTNWNSGSFESIPAAGLNFLPNITEQHNIYSQGNVFVLQNNTLRYVQTAEDYYGLGINPGNTVNLSANAISTIPAGPNILRDGAAYTISGALYIANSNTSLYVPSVSMALDFGINWGAIRFNLSSNVLTSGYPSAGTLTRWVKPGGSGLAYVTNRSTVNITSAAAGIWGINTTTQPATTINSASLFNATGSATLGQFVRNVDDGGMYYGIGGASHYIEAYSAFINLGGATANIINVHSDFLSATPRGYTYGW